MNIEITPEFQQKIRSLSKRYRKIRSDLEPILDQLRQGEAIGDQIRGVGFPVYKLRVKNSNIQKGKSGGYRLIYWLKLKNTIVLLDIYSKSDQVDLDVQVIRKIIERSS
jgi:mRNA-degrading endonuclease RelE of RelBE toxin-antitoxin system